jgi:hypothetical protein
VPGRRSIKIQNGRSWYHSGGPRMVDKLATQPLVESGPPPVQSIKRPIGRRERSEGRKAEPSTCQLGCHSHSQHRPEAEGSDISAVMRAQGTLFTFCHIHQVRGMRKTVRHTESTSPSLRISHSSKGQHCLVFSGSFLSFPMCTCLWFT